MIWSTNDGQVFSPGCLSQLCHLSQKVSPLQEPRWSRERQQSDFAESPHPGFPAASSELSCQQPWSWQSRGSLPHCIPSGAFSAGLWGKEPRGVGCGKLSCCISVSSSFLKRFKSHLLSLIDQHQGQLDLFSPTQMQFKSHVLRITWNLCFVRVKGPVPLCHYLKGINHPALLLFALKNKTDVFWKPQTRCTVLVPLARVTSETDRCHTSSWVVFKPRVKRKAEERRLNPSKWAKRSLSLLSCKCFPSQRAWPLWLKTWAVPSIRGCGERGQRTPPKTKSCPGSRVVSISADTTIEYSQERRGR